jgi:hypothetical protein
MKSIKKQVEQQSQSYNVKNALARRNKEVIDEDKRQAYPYRVANRRVFDMEKRDVMDEIPRPQPNIGIFQSSSLLASQVFSLLQDVASNLATNVILNPKYFETRLATGMFAKAREYLLNYINELKFKVIPEINRTQDRNLINQTISDLNKLYTLLDNIVSVRLNDAIMAVEAVENDEIEDIDLEEAGKLRGLSETLTNEKTILEDLFNQISTLRQLVLQQLTTGNEVSQSDIELAKDTGLRKGLRELYSRMYDRDELLLAQENQQQVQDVNEPFQEDADLYDMNEELGAGYDPIAQQKAQFEEGEKRYRDEMKQDEDDLEGHGLRFRIAKTKKKQR